MSEYPCRHVFHPNNHCMRCNKHISQLEREAEIVTPTCYAVDAGLIPFDDPCDCGETTVDVCGGCCEKATVNAFTGKAVSCPASSAVTYQNHGDERPYAGMTEADLADQDAHAWGEDDHDDE